MAEVAAQRRELQDLELELSTALASVKAGEARDDSDDLARLEGVEATPRSTRGSNIQASQRGSKQGAEATPAEQRGSTRGSTLQASQRGSKQGADATTAEQRGSTRGSTLQPPQRGSTQGIEATPPEQRGSTHGSTLQASQRGSKHGVEATPAGSAAPSAKASVVLDAPPADAAE